MGWQGSVHGEWCHSKTYPTTCRYCGARVFFFTCDCGCKVFFNSLGPPWPTHLCWQRAQSALGADRMARAMADYMMTPLNWGPQAAIEESYSEKVILKQREPAPPRPHLVRQDPAPGATVSEVGHLREIGSRVDVFRVFEVRPESLIGLQLLGPLARKPYVQVTLHSGDLSKQDGQSFTCLLDERLLQRSGAARGDLVFFSLTGSTIPGLKCAWICDSLSIV